MSVHTDDLASPAWRGVGLSLAASVLLHLGAVAWLTLRPPPESGARATPMSMERDAPEPPAERPPELGQRDSRTVSLTWLGFE
ncbi:MAG: hypothetical protein AAF995_08215, partial [Planctomycetota bacterium]